MSAARQWMWGATSGALAVAACALSSPAPVAASPATKIEYLSGTKSVAPAAEAAKDAPCPKGFDAIGGGSSNAGGAQGPIVGLGLTPRLNWFSTVDNLRSSGRLTMTTIAVCADGALANAAQVVFSSDTSIKPHRKGAALAVCPTGETVAGGGVSTLSGGGAGTRVLVATMPRHPSSLYGWSGVLDNLASHEIVIRSLAVCIQPSQSSHVRYQVTSQAIGPGVHTVQAACGNGTQVLGGGGSDAGAWDEARLTSSEPAGDGSGNPTGWKVTFENRSAISQSVATIAVCYQP